MKITNINAKVDSSGRHNDRNFNIAYAPHIDGKRTADNLYYTYDGDTGRTFAETERKFYEEAFGERLRAQNEKKIEQRHRDRIQTVESLLKKRATRPEDKILQVGNMDEHPDGEKLWECALEYARRFDAIYGDHCKIIDMALHMDEATPHVHIRRAWVAEDKDGMHYPSQSKAMEQMGIKGEPMEIMTASGPVADTRDRRSAVIAFTKMDRDLFTDICIEKGLDVERDDAPKGKQVHLSMLQYKQKKARECIEKAKVEIAELERKRDFLSTKIAEAEEAEKAGKEIDRLIGAMQGVLEASQYIQGLYGEDLEEARKEQRIERLRRLGAIYNEEYLRRARLSEEHGMDGAAAIMEATRKLRAENGRLKRFIMDSGLQESYRQYQEIRREEREKRRLRQEKSGEPGMYGRPRGPREEGRR